MTANFSTQMTAHSLRIMDTTAVGEIARLIIDQAE
jgi:hypothetical protein